MSKNQKQMVRQPATNLPHRKKQLQKGKIQQKKFEEK